MRLLFFIALIFIVAAPVAKAACTFPDGSEGEIVYNETSHVPQYCDGNEWIAFAPLPGDGMAAWDKDGPTSGLVGWWKLDETSGPTFADSSGTGNTGNQHNTITGYGAEGMIDNALDLGVPGDPTTNAVRIPSDPSISNLTQFTLSVWAYTYNRKTHVLMSAGHLGPAAAAGFNFKIENRSGDKKIELSLEKSDGAKVLIDGPYDILPNRWYHIVATYDGAVGHIYVDGSLIREEAHINAIDVPYAGDTFIGVYGSGSNAWLTGKMDDVRIYNRALSPREVKDLYATGGPCSHPPGHEGDIIFNESLGVMQYCEGDAWVSVGTCSDWQKPELHLKFDETTGVPLDSSGANTAVTATGTVWQPTGGVDGSGAIEFDDASDVIDAGNVLSSFEDMTVSTWVYITSNPGYSLRVYDDSGHSLIHVPGNNVNIQYKQWYVHGFWRTTNPVLNYGEWAHVAITYSPESVANDPAIYLNGVPQDVTEIQAPLLPRTPNANTMYIGNRVHGDRGLNGRLDDFRLYDRALSHEEIENIYKDGLRRMRTNGLVGHWPFDETEGSIAKDATGSGYDADILGGVELDQPGQIGTAFRFDNATGDDMVEYADGDELEFNGDFAVAAWIKPDGKSNSHIVGRDAGANSNYKLEISLSGDDVKFYVNFDSDDGEAVSGNLAGFNQWSHVLGMRSGDKIQLFIDGVLADELTRAGPIYATDYDDPGQIGRRSSSASSRFFGEIDDVRIYNRALSAEEIALMYEDQAPGYGCTNAGEAFYNTAHDVLQYCNGHRWVAVGKCEVAASGLVAHYKMDETSGLIQDSSGYGNHSTIVNGTVEYVPDGVVGRAIKFNSATDAHFEIPHSESLFLDDRFTVALWMRGASGAVGDSYARLVAKSDIASPWADWELTRWDLFEEVMFRVDTDAQANYTINEDGLHVFDDNWHHVAYTVNQGTLEYYQNGEKLDTETYAHGGGLANTHPLRIGGSPITGGRYYEGMLDEVRVYKRVLSPGEIRSLYDMGADSVLSDPCAYDNVFPGAECTGGMIYAGTSPHLNAPMYTTPADAPSALPWNNDSSNWVETFLKSTNMGALNTLTLTEWDADSSTPEVEPHQAAQYCADLTAHGYNDWYLPAENELKILHQNKDTIGGFSNSNYWSSTERYTGTDIDDAISVEFSSGAGKIYSKTIDYPLRCVRKDLNKTCGQEIAGNPLIMVFDSTNTADGSAANQITIPAGSGAFNYDVTWHDADCNTGTLTGQTGNATFTVPTQGLVTVRITGDFPHFDQTSDLDTGLVDVAQWGDIQWGSFQDALRNHDNLAGFSATDAPDLSNVSDVDSMFREATIFNGSIGHWDVSNITRFSNLFRDAHVFNADISSWNVSNAQKVVRMFDSARSFNRDIGNWDVRNVRIEGFLQMFLDARAFNQDIGNWDIAYADGFVAADRLDGMFQGAISFNQDISGWDTSKIKIMKQTFKDTPFNQDISGWDVSNVQNMDRMFENASNFDQDLSGWDVGSVTAMGEMFDGSGLSTANYDAILNGWWALHNSADGPLQSGVTLGAGTIQYSAGAAAAHTGLTTDPPNWTINDGGEQ